MKKLLSLLAFAVISIAASAQAKYGTIHYDSLFQHMPEYEEVQAQIKTLKAQYDQEIAYNEESFKRQFAEFLQGQKSFSQNILLKRQSDLQNAMERGIAFREEANRLLKKAEAELLAPLHKRLQAAIKAVGIKRHYDMVINLDDKGAPFLNPALTEDATAFVKAQLQGLSVPAPELVLAEPLPSAMSDSDVAE